MLKLLICMSLVSGAVEAALEVKVAAEAAVLMNGNTGQILYAKGEHDRHHPASITKIATALVALEQASDRLDVGVVADADALGWLEVAAKRRSNYSLPAHWLEPGCSHIGLKKGEMLSLRDLLHGMMLVSGDDASNVIAKYAVGGEVQQFMEVVNRRLGEIGCRGTHFSNPHGLYHPDHYTTAYDMALLTRVALQNGAFRSLVKTVRYQRPATAQQKTTTFLQTNKLLVAGHAHYYPHAIGVKTGWIGIAQNTLVAAAEKEGRLLIAVLLKSKERSDIFRDAVALFEAAFAEPQIEKTVVKRGQQPFALALPSDGAPGWLAAATRAVATYADDEVAIRYYPAEAPRLSYHLAWDRVALPVAAGQQVGTLTVTSDDGQVERQVPLRALDAVEESTWQVLRHFWERSWSPMQVLAAVALGLFILAGAIAKMRR